MFGNKKNIEKCCICKRLIRVEEKSIKPIINKNENNIFWVNDILFSENLTSEESSKFLWLLKKAQGKLKEN